MNESVTPPVAPTPASSTPVPFPMVCPVCHLPITPEAYFCPNCGAKLKVPPLSKSLTSQLLLYGFSLVLPFIAYLAITKWQGITYIRSSDPDTRRIGFIALALLVISSIFVIWLTTQWFDNAINSVTNGVGGLGGNGSSSLNSLLGN
jgi:hypothetical protein